MEAAEFDLSEWKFLSPLDDSELPPCPPGELDPAAENAHGDQARVIASRPARKCTERCMMTAVEPTTDPARLRGDDGSRLTISTLQVHYDPPTEHLDWEWRAAIGPGDDQVSGLVRVRGGFVVSPQGRPGGWFSPDLDSYAFVNTVGAMIGHGIPAEVYDDAAVGRLAVAAGLAQREDKVSSVLELRRRYPRLDDRTRAWSRLTRFYGGLSVFVGVLMLVTGSIGLGRSDSGWLRVCLLILGLGLTVGGSAGTVTGDRLRSRLWKQLKRR